MEAILKEVWSVDQALGEIGVTREQLAEALRAGEAARATCTENDPATMRGIFVWGRIIRSLREQLIPDGWGRSATGALETAIRGDRKVAISCATGDEATGLDDVPFTKYPKGPRTVEAVARNNLQLDLFDRLETAVGAKAPHPEPETVDPTEETVTHVLLWHRADGMIRAELSLPQMIGPDGRVTSWAQRIILPPIEIGDGDDLGGGPEQTDEIVVDVIRRR